MSDEANRQTGMTMDRSKESLSALTDGEIDGKGADFLIRRVSSDPELNGQWQRFHLFRACMHREFTASVSLVDKVAAALESEPSPRREGGWPSGLLRIGVGGAIAASVALVAVIGLGNRVDRSPIEDETSAPGFVSQTTALDRQFSPTAVPTSLGSNAERGGLDGAAATRRQINRYMIRHGQLAGESGFISFTPVLTAPIQVESESAAPAAASGTGEARDASRR
jgi:sigma-E factor negative regulatory protein RseA